MTTFTTDDCVAFIKRALADGPQPSAVVHEKARIAGYTDRMVKRARQTAGIVGWKAGGGMDGRWMVRLPDDSEHPTLDSSSIPPTTPRPSITEAHARHKEEEAAIVEQVGYVEDVEAATEDRPLSIMEAAQQHNDRFASTQEAKRKAAEAEKEKAAKEAEEREQWANREERAEALRAEREREEREFRETADTTAAKEFLQTFLAEKPRSIGIVRHAAEKAGIHPRITRLAAEQLGITTERFGPHEDRHVWSLPRQAEEEADHGR